MAPRVPGGSRLSLRRSTGPIAFRLFLPMTPRAGRHASGAGHWLAVRAKVAAAPGDDGPSDFRAAARAWQPFTPVHLVVLLVVARNTASVHKIGYRRAPQFDRFQQNFKMDPDIPAPATGLVSQHPLLPSRRLAPHEQILLAQRPWLAGERR